MERHRRDIALKSFGLVFLRQFLSIRKKLPALRDGLTIEFSSVVFYPWKLLIFSAGREFPFQAGQTHYSRSTHNQKAFVI
jgi:hypothetical protein